MFDFFALDSSSLILHHTRSLLSDRRPIPPGTSVGVFNRRSATLGVSPSRDTGAPFAGTYSTLILQLFNANNIHRDRGDPAWF